MVINVMARRKSFSPSSIPCQVWILAGGLSRRMGKNKAKLRLGKRTLLQHLKNTAQSTDLPVQILRKDLFPRCGPLGGIATALIQSKQPLSLFLACDMPFVTSELLTEMVQTSLKRNQPLFARSNGQFGFPAIIPKLGLSAVLNLMNQQQFSIQSLASKLKAKPFLVPKTFHWELFNINSPNDWSMAQELWKKRKVQGRTARR